MQIRFGNGDMSKMCFFTVGNKQVANFNSDLITQLSAQPDTDVKSELKNMLLQAVARTGLQMTPDHDRDLTAVIDKYVDLIVKNNG